MDVQAGDWTTCHDFGIVDIGYAQETCLVVKFSIVNMKLENTVERSWFSSVLQCLGEGGKYLYLQVQ